MSAPGPFTRRLSRAVLAACHDYVPGRELAQLEGWSPARRAAIAASRLAARYGVARRRFDLDEAAERLANISAALDELEHVYALLGDEPSRTRLVELFTLRVLGAEHVEGPVGYAQQRARERELERSAREAAGTLTVPDPYAPSLDRYRLDGPAGTTIRLHATAPALASVFSLGQYRYAGVQARPGDVVLDGGAGWGDTVLWFADLVGAAGRVLAFEFAPGNLRALAENLKLNPELAPRVEIHEQALWERGGERLSFAEAGLVTTVGVEGEHAVTTITIDELVERGSLERLDFVKLDVEGAEPHVLAGATEALRRFRPALAVAAYHDPWHLIRLPRLVDELGLGYRLFFGHAAAGTDETVLFAAPADRS